MQWLFLKLYYEKTNKERPLLSIAKIMQICEYPTQGFYANTF